MARKLGKTAAWKTDLREWSAEHIVVTNCTFNEFETKNETSVGGGAVDWTGSTRSSALDRVVDPGSNASEQPAATLEMARAASAAGVTFIR